LTAPASTPRTKYRWKEKKTMSGMMIEIIAPVEMIQ
jgi:hypothetical protein